MDNQFKNVKTHARLLSKAMWYEWRMKIYDGLRDGLLVRSRELDDDAEVLSKQEKLLDSVLPALVEEHAKLAAEASMLQAQVDALASCDQEKLTDARERLLVVDEELQEKRKMVAELQSKLADHEQTIEEIMERKEECLGEIREAERVVEECRGWSGAEVMALKGT
jgi:kinetochore protein Spc7/SPC105